MENFFVSFYSKTIIQSFLSSNEQKVTSNEQKVTSNQQKITSNEQKVTSNDQKPTSNEQNLTSNEQKLTTNEQNLTSNEQKVSPHNPKHLPTSIVPQGSVLGPLLFFIYMIWIQPLNNAKFIILLMTLISYISMTQ